MRYSVPVDGGEASITSRPVRILMVAPSFVPWENAESIVSGKLVLAFLRAGWHVDVISRAWVPSRSGSYSVEWKEPWLALQPVVHHVDTRMANLADMASNPRIPGQRALRLYPMVRGVSDLIWARHAARYATRLHDREPYDAMLSRSFPEIAHLAALWAAKKVRIPWIANWNDPTLVKRPRPYAGGLDAKLGWIRERSFAAIGRTAAWHTFPSEMLRQYIAKYMPVEILSRSSVIPHIGLDDAPGKDRSGGDSFVICHAGELTMPRDPDSFFSGFAQFVRDEGPDVRAKVVLCGINEARGRDMVSRYGIADRVEFVSPRPFAQSQEILAQATIGLIIEAPCEHPIFLPSKLIDYVGLRKPILAITPRGSTVEQLLAAHGGGVAVECRSSSAVHEQLRRMYASWKAGNLARDFDVSALSSQFSAETILQQYVDLFSRLGVKSFA